jgi:hypothetical protein
MTSKKNHPQPYSMEGMFSHSRITEAQPIPISIQMTTKPSLNKK